MAFTYNAALSSNRDKVRFYINDKVADSGPLPGDVNFTDEELDGVLTMEGDNWQRSVASCYDMLQSAWAIYSDMAVGPRRQSYGQIATKYAWLSKKWRDLYGYTSREGVKAVGITRKDGYSDDVPSDDYQTTGTEWTGDFEYVRPA